MGAALRRLGFFTYLGGRRDAAPVLAEALELFVAAERLGFDSVWVAQHHFGPVVGTLASPLPFLASVAARTRWIRLGTAVVILPLEHPVRLARAVVDLLSGGRLELGLGSGTDPAVFAALGYDPERRRELMEEGLRAGARSGRVPGGLVPAVARPGGAVPAGLPQHGRRGRPAGAGDELRFQVEQANGLPARAGLPADLDVPGFVDSGVFHLGSADDVVASLRADPALRLATELICQVGHISPGFANTMRALELLATEVGPALGWRPGRDLERGRLRPATRPGPRAGRTGRGGGAWPPGRTPGRSRRPARGR